VTSTVQNGRTLSYAYDAASNRTGVTWPDTGSNALTVSYVYDPLNNVTQVEENGATSGPGLLATYAYDSLARRASIGRAGGSGLATTYGYGANGLLASVKQALAGSAATTLSFGYNTAGQISARTDSSGLNQYTSATGVEQTYVGGLGLAVIPPFEPEGLAGVVVRKGASFVGFVAQTLAAGYLAAEGDPQPLANVETSQLPSLTDALPPALPVGDPSDPLVQLLTPTIPNAPSC
jgi:YD repeat-containing protein